MRIAALGVVVVLALPVPSGGFVVDHTGDAVDSVPGDGICATSVVTGSGCTLRAAIQESNALAGTQTVTLGAGVHTLDILGRGEDAGVTGDLDVTGDLIIDGAGSGSTIIDPLGLDRVLEVHGASVDLTVSDLEIRNGETFDEEGAGIRNGSGGLLLLARVVLEDNEALGESNRAVGGGVSSDAGGTLVVVDSNFRGNRADRGGGIFGGATQLLDTTLEGNVASRGSAFLSYSPTTIERCTISGNEATLGGTVDVLSNSLVIRNSTISGNLDPGVVLATDDRLTLENVTVYDNETPEVLRVFSPGAAELVNTVIVNPLATTECFVNDGATIDSLGHNVDGDGSCVGDPSDRTTDDPGLGPLADNGGSTRTHLPLAGSLLIDTGSDLDCPALDQRHEDRPQDGNGNGLATCDVGAVEVPEPEGLVLALGAAGALAGVRRFRRRSAR